MSNNIEGQGSFFPPQDPREARLPETVGGNYFPIPDLKDGGPVEQPSKPALKPSFEDEFPDDDIKADDNAKRRLDSGEISSLEAEQGGYRILPNIDEIREVLKQIPDMEPKQEPQEPKFVPDAKPTTAVPKRNADAGSFKGEVPFDELSRREQLVAEKKRPRN